MCAIIIHVFSNRTISHRYTFDVLKCCHVERNITGVCSSRLLVLPILFHSKNRNAIGNNNVINSNHVRDCEAGNGFAKERGGGAGQFLGTRRIFKRRWQEVYALFTGNKDTSTGISWCPDCVKGSIWVCQMGRVGHGTLLYQWLLTVCLVAVKRYLRFLF